MSGIISLALFGALVCAIAYVAIEAARRLTDFGDDE
jgi:hypothetical protein